MFLSLRVLGLEFNKKLKSEEQKSIKTFRVPFAGSLCEDF